MCCSEEITGAEMRTLKTILCSVLSGVCGLAFMNVHAADHLKRTARPTAEVAPSVLPGSTKDSRITAFDIAPDGTQLGLLYTNWPSSTSFILSAAIWDIRSKAVAGRSQIGSQSVDVPPGPVIDDEMIFTADKKYLLVLALGKVWILDGNSCAPIRSIDAPRSELEAIHIVTVSPSAVTVVYKRGYNQFYVALFELPTANLVAGWQSSTFPQSISPNGKLMIGPDSEYNSDGVTNLQLLDLQTGAKIKSIPVEFGFKKGRTSEEKGSVTARFLDNEQIVVIPDNMVDHTGHHSGTSIHFINISQNRIVRKITPKNFGPTGELAVSPDLSYFVVYSSYASALAVRSDGLWPNFHKPELMLFSKNDTNAEALIPGLNGDGAVAHLRNMILPRLSSNASFIAIAQTGTVQVFQTKD